MARSRKFEMFKVTNYDPIEIRFDPDDSIFYTSSLGKMVKSNDLNELKDLILKEIKSKEEIVWKPVIEVCLDNDNQYYGSNQTAGFTIEKKLLGEKKYPDGRVEKVMAQILYGGDNSESKDWVPVKNYNNCDEIGIHTKILEYNPQKYEKLQFIRERMEEVRIKLMKIIQDDKIETFLIGVNEQKFMQIDYDNGGN